MTTAPLLGLLLDVDGPIASPVTRSIAIPSIARDLAALANAGNPVIFNTGRSDAFIAEQVVPPLLAAGLEPGAPVWAICEKGAVWAAIDRNGLGEVFVDLELAMPADFAADMRAYVEEHFDEFAFFDDTKRAMVSVEQHVHVASDDYLGAQPRFDAHAHERLAARGFGTVREGDERPDAAGRVHWRIDPTIISTDVESVRLGKDLGAARAVELLEERGIRPQHWRTMGDSRGDYRMADWLAERGERVRHVDVRPAEGVPATAYPVLTAGDLIHDEAGAVFLSRWAEASRRGDLGDDE
ncbi:hydroxymethylpyrimidine pyrophosphatase-like HAD family hydrolase [Agromyces hippuratus]|uniref:Hydroxymethylpyrimidine pyrophosphatase-like HAD family hydrolase n=1 Tax=Agromyces hippuratus TaxID=286438 RepID=A0A852WNH9_9MICO|nr:hypothetical protein [Agromyces hippuratus]NYG19489.1 hydroxymethylpyrimidine pyrophosphatase-like HAD family hydrolase [Agromyces hippuratus]